MKNLGTVLLWATHLAAVAGAAANPVMQWVAGAWIVGYLTSCAVYVFLVVVVVVGSPEYVRRARWVLKRNRGRWPGPPP